MDTLRKPFFFLALGLIVLVVLLEMGSLVLPQLPGSAGSLASRLPPGEVTAEFLKLDQAQQQKLAQIGNTDKPPGRGIPSLALVDGVLLFSMVVISAGIWMPQAVQGRIQGCASLIFSVVIILAAIALIFSALFAVILMVALFLSVPFGTLIYLAAYGFFDRSGAAAILSLLMLLKIGFAICLLLAQQRFLQNKVLVLLILASLAANIVVSFLHGLPPIILVSITDGIAAIINGICGAVFALLLLIGALPAVLKALRVRG